MLQDKLDSKMKVRYALATDCCSHLTLHAQGTKADGAISRLFVGKMKSYVRCVNVDYESSRVEDFNGRFSVYSTRNLWLSRILIDISLNVKGMRNLQESFRDYVQVEMLEGENKYQAEGYGLQDAKKGIIFHSFPPVLHIQLKRFEYDIQRDAMVKV